MKTITLFSFGYWGWGTSTSHLVAAVDAIEESRGFKPPIFVDVRFNRAVRALGFKGAAFESQLGDDRYRWMKSLGNERIVTKSAPGMQIAEPSAANELLDLAVQASNDKRRLIFFCSCMWPRYEGKVNCHRTLVTSLLLARGGRRGIPIKVVEWPGGKPGHISIDLQPPLFSKVRGDDCRSQSVVQSAWVIGMDLPGERYAHFNVAESSSTELPVRQTGKKTNGVFRSLTSTLIQTSVSQSTKKNQFVY